MLWPGWAAAANSYWDGTGTSWDTPLLVHVWQLETPDPLAKPGASDIAFFNITTANSPQTVNLDAAQAALGLNFTSTGTVLIESSAGGSATRLRSAVKVSRSTLGRELTRSVRP